jgi:hypothetical protein
LSGGKLRRAVVLVLISLLVFVIQGGACSKKKGAAITFGSLAETIAARCWKTLRLPSDSLDLTPRFPSSDGYPV